ncbi:hypothetical protein DPMN_128878 [Dreissena polymorpha]|uniref:Uncharacterized protein n=1 Tax=Dreissena polymorpha TaxID=45954 RepID=A0A9D4H090_DREPO|nr:hypothetical protein DPMN_128878 [Dreissena polymorpha]
MPMIWEEKKSLVTPLPKKGNLKLCENYRTISLTSQPSKVRLDSELGSGLDFQLQNHL